MNTTSVETLTRAMRGGEPMSSVAALAATAPEWARSFVDAAERRVHELDDALAAAREDVLKLRHRAEQFVAENDELHQRYVEAVGRDDAPAPGPQAGPRAVGGVEAERARELAERVDILMAENALMVEQSSVVQAELDRCSADLDARTAEATRARDELDAATARIEDLEGSSSGWRDDRKKLEQRYVAHASEVAAANAQLAELKEGLAALHAQNATLRDSLDEKTRVCSDLTDRLEADGDELWQRVQAASQRCRELAQDLAAATQRAESSEEKARSAARALDQVRADNAGMLRVMGGMEKQLAAYASREEGVAAAGREAKEKAENALLARDKAQAKADQGARELERLRAEKVADAGLLQQRCREAAETEQRRLQAEVRRRDAEIRRRDEAHAEALAIAERCARDLDRHKTVADRAQAALKHCQAAATAAADGLERRAADADQRAADAVARARAAEKALAKAVEGRDAVSAPADGAEPGGMSAAEARALTAKARDAASQLAAAERDAQKLARELEAEKQARARDVADARRDADAEKRELEKALDAQRRAAADAHHQFAAATERHRGQLAKVSADRDAHAKDADARLREEHDTVARLAAYERELEVKLAAAAADLEAQRAYGADLADRCQVAERRASESALALSKSIAEQDLLIKRYARQSVTAAVSPGALAE